VVQVSLLWRSLEPPDVDYTVFVHLVDDEERVWAQHDGQPAGGSRPTSSWQPGEEFADNHGLALPSDIAPGEYQIAVGLYDAATGQRLPVLSVDEGPAQNRVLVGPVLIVTTDG
jgi:hypothetical protein